MFKRVQWWSILGVVGMVAGCGGMSAEDAQERCETERGIEVTSCVDSASFTQCLSCYEECGDSCQRASGCPAVFSCPE
ncbi:uncharacterized protein CMC5_008850 [Chondromyces crocatus]|uniref:Uncharacterized protein n=2 Tax=Chondromyces crocatus TaxID=52 RepID=A0A0K1E7C7_CHOCO|nr:uncharacterized protein CMC5_008850 [Chondromyces crocatus]